MSDSAWKAFQSKDYAALWTGAFISNTGTWMERIALGVYIADTTGSSGWTGLGSALLFLPSVILAPVGGTLADRFERRRYLQVVTVLQLVIAAVITLLAMFHALALPALLTLVCLTGCAGTLVGPAFGALLTELVPEESMGSAVFLNSGQFNLARIVGPAIAAVILAAGGVTWALAFNTLSFLAVLGALRNFSARSRPTVSAPGSQLTVWKSAREGFLAVRRDPAISRVLSLTLISSALVSPFISFIPIYALRELKSDSSGASMLVTVQGVGAVLSAVTSSAYISGFGFRRWVSAAAMLLIPLGVAYWLAPTLSIAAVFILMLGAAYLAVMSGCSSVVLIRAPKILKARVASIYRAGIDGSYGVGVLVLGTLGDLFGLRVSCIGAIVLYAGYLFFLHRSKQPLLHELDVAPEPVTEDQITLAEETP